MTLRPSSLNKTPKAERDRSARIISDGLTRLHSNVNVSSDAITWVTKQAVAKENSNGRFME